MRAVLVGLGAVGQRVARQLLADPAVEELVAVGRDPAWAAARTEGLDGRVSLRRSVEVPAGTDVVVITRPSDAAANAAAALRAGAHVIAALDDPAEVRALLALDDTARRARRCVVVGVTMAPGLSCLLARVGAARLDRVTEIHVASFGTGGPTCARRHHAALSEGGVEWYDGARRRRPGGSGRELVWFPEPIGGADCYRANLVDPALLVPAFPGVERVTAKMAATRRDRFTSPLPMLRPPHAEGTLGATRVEVRGRLGPAASSVVLGGFGRPALVAGTLAALSASWAAQGRLGPPGAGGLAAMTDHPGALVREMIGRGIRIEEFAGDPV